MATNYPTALDSYVTLVDNTDDVLAAHMNDRGNAIEAIEAKLGLNSSIVVTSIDYFLKHASGAYRTHRHDGGSDDGSTALGALTGLTLANDIDVGSYHIRAETFYADVLTGTAPLTITSTTKVSNLNVEQVDGFDASATPTASTLVVADATGFITTPSQAPTDDYQVANKKYVDDTGVPSNIITIWSGSIASIPSGWVICDGTNGTPDLSDKFVMGVKSTGIANVDDTGSPDYPLGGSGSKMYTFTSTTTGSGAAGSGSSGGSHRHTTMHPYYCLAYIMKQ